MTGFHKILSSERGQTQKSVPCTQSPQIAKVICAIRSQHVISVGLGSDSEGVREGPSLDYVGGVPSLDLVVMVIQLLSHVQLFATPWTVAHQAPLSLKFSWQE